MSKRHVYRAIHRRFGPSLLFPCLGGAGLCFCREIRPRPCKFPVKTGKGAPKPLKTNEADSPVSTITGRPSGRRTKELLDLMLEDLAISVARQGLGPDRHPHGHLEGGKARGDER